MLQVAFKRLLILLPAVWLIASVVFLLSKTLPGAAAENLLDGTDQNPNSSAKTENRLQAYRQLLRKTGQDLPLFYFSVATAAETDTLHKIFSSTERQALKNLTLTYGNWPAISSFYLNLKVLQQQATQLTQGHNNFRELQFLTSNLLHNPAPQALKNGIEKLQKTARQTQEPLLIVRADQTAASLHFLLNHPKPNQNFIPAIHWHGLQNQYQRWLAGLAQGDLGISTRDSRPVTSVIGEAFRITFGLAIGAFILTSAAGPAIALFLSRKIRRNWQTPVLSLLYVLESIPLFLLALAVLALAGFAGWLYSFPEETGFILAIACLFLASLPYLTSQAFAAFQSTLKETYIVAARAKGIPETKLLRQHVFRNSLLPLITLLSDFLPALLTGTVVLEVIFSLPGMGRLLVNAVLARDHAVITGLVLGAASFKMLAHVTADLLYALADPRVRAPQS